MLPDFVIIGAQKAGSTALMRYLDDAQGVYMPRHETRYFREPWYSFQDEGILEREMAPAPAGVQRHGIKCPDLLGAPSAPERVHAALPTAQLVAILREPVARAVSAYHHYMHMARIPIAPIDAGFRKILSGAYDAKHPHAREILDYGRYGEALTRWFEVAGRERMLVLLDDDLRADREGAVNTVLGFLGLPPQAGLTHSRRVLNEGVYSLPRLRFRTLRHWAAFERLPGSDEKFLNFDTRGPVKRAVNQAVLEVDNRVLKRVFGNEKPTLDPALTQQLREYYRDDVATLSDLLGRDLSAWQA